MKLQKSILLISLLSLIAWSAEARVAPTAEAIIPAAKGQPAPSAKVRTEDGVSIDFKTRLGGKKTLLIFYRGGWCPYCNKHFQELRKVESPAKEKGYQILAVSPDKPEELKKSKATNKMNYSLLSDSKASLAKAFGIAFQVDKETFKMLKGYGIDLELASGAKHHILPVPSVFVIDEKGLIQYQYSNADYKVRMSSDEILAELN